MTGSDCAPKFQSQAANRLRISAAVPAQAAPAMSAGEGLDEAAKDAADIAAFFKSGKSERGESGSGRATATPSVGGISGGSATLLSKNTDRGEMRLALWTCPERCARLVIIHPVPAR